MEQNLNELELRALQHLGHRLRVVTYGEGVEVEQVKLECRDCGKILMDFHELREEKGHGGEAVGHSTTDGMRGPPMPEISLGDLQWTENDLRTGYLLQLTMCELARERLLMGLELGVHPDIELLSDDAMVCWPIFAKSKTDGRMEMYVAFPGQDEEGSVVYPESETGQPRPYLHHERVHMEDLNLYLRDKHEWVRRTRHALKMRKRDDGD